MRRISLLILSLTLFSTLSYGQSADPYARRRTPSTFADLGASSNGEMRYCSDCQATSPCTGGGTGAVAERVAGAWNCSTGGSGTGDALTSNPLSQFAATTSAQLRGVLSDENGTGADLFDNATNATLITPTIAQINSTSGSANILLNTTGLIQIGGVSSSFPGLKRTSSFFSVRKADDSDFTPLMADSLYATTNVRVNSLGNYGWTGSQPGNPGIGGSLDTNFSRAAAGVVQVGTTASNALGTIRAAKHETASGVQWTSGTGSPEGVVTAGVGSLYTRTDGGASTTLYVKESGAGNNGWVAK